MEVDKKSSYVKSGSWLNIFLLYLCGTSAAGAMGMFGPVAVDISQKFTVTTTEVGSAIGLLFLPMIFLGSPIGSLVDKVGARTVLRFSVFFVAVASLAIYYVPTFFGVQASILVIGSAIVGIMTSCQATLMSAITGKRQIQALSLWSTVSPVGIALGSFIIASFAGTDNWQGGFVLHASIVAIAFLSSLILPKPEITPMPAPREGDEVVFSSVFRNVNIIRLALALCVGSIIGFGTSMVAPAYMHKMLGISLESSTNFVGVASIGSVVGGLLVGVFLSKGWSSKKTFSLVVITGLISGAAFYAPIGIIVITVIALIFWQAASGAQIASTFTLLPHTLAHPSQAGRAAGFLSQIVGVGMTLSAPIFFAVLEMNTWYMFVALVSAAWVVAFFIMPIWGSMNKAKLSANSAKIHSEA